MGMTVRGPGLAYNIPDHQITAKCYMMDEFEILRGNNDLHSVEFENFNDCVKKAKEGTNNASYAVVAVWEKDDKDRKKPGTLYIKKDVPGKSTNADVEGAPRFLRRGITNKATFWRTPALSDWIEEKSPAADIHDGVVELKK